MLELWTHVLQANSAHLQNPPPNTIPLTLCYVWGCIIYYKLIIYNTINTNEHYAWGQAPKPPFQFVIHKSIMA